MPGIFVSTFRSLEIVLCFLSQGKKQLHFIRVAWAKRHFYRNLIHVFVQRLCFSACAKF